MRLWSIFVLLLALMHASYGHADAPLPGRLGLDSEQSRELAGIEASYRKEFAALRQAYNRESRALRRARLANDSAEVARLTMVTDAQREQLAGMRQAQDLRIAALLRPDQQARFAAYVQERQQMVGSSRDERLFE